MTRYTEQVSPRATRACLAYAVVTPLNDNEKPDRTPCATASGQGGLSQTLAASAPFSPRAAAAGGTGTCAGGIGDSLPPSLDPVGAFVAPFHSTEVAQ